MRRVIGDPEGRNRRFMELIRRVEVDASTAHRPRDFRRTILDRIEPGARVLDCGRSSRHLFDAIAGKAGVIETLDIHADGDYPDIQFDLCDRLTDPDMADRYDHIVCLAVLEHCHDPFRAAANLMRMLKPGGTLFGYVPFIFRYHGSLSLEIQDYVRFSRDGIAAMFAGADRIQLYPVRGRLTAGLNFLVPFWKRRVEAFPTVAAQLDRFYRGDKNDLQVSGYNFIVKK